MGVGVGVELRTGVVLKVGVMLNVCERVGLELGVGTPRSTCVIMVELRPAGGPHWRSRHVAELVTFSGAVELLIETVKRTVRLWPEARLKGPAEIKLPPSSSQSMLSGRPGLKRVCAGTVS